MIMHPDSTASMRGNPAGRPEFSSAQGRNPSSPFRTHRQALLEGLSRVARVVEEQRARFPLVVDNEPPPPPKRVDLAAIGRRKISAAVERVKSGYALLLGAEAKEIMSAANTAELSVRLGRAFYSELRTGLRVLLAAFGIAGGWATLVPLSGAVVVPGTLVTQSNVKKVQHPTGGVIAQILVEDGAHVKAGQLLARLDPTTARTNDQLVSKQLDETRARIARLVAERDGLDAPQFPAELTKRKSEEDVTRLIASETSLFKARAAARHSQKDLLQSRISQFGEEIVGLKSQLKSKEAQLDLISGELKGLKELFEKHLVPITRLTTLQREAARIDGEHGQLLSAVAETQSKISEAQLQILQVDKEFRTEVVKSLHESQEKEAELVEKSVAARDQLNRVDIRAPTSGTVHQLSVHTVGGVVGAGEVLMEIVPDTDSLEIEARLPPVDVDQVHTGQTTLVRLSAFNQRTTPQLTGVVSYVSADASEDSHAGKSYYTVKVSLPAEEHRRLGNLQLVSGMPAEVFLQTGSRTMLSYMLKPITDQFHRMFRER